MNSCGRARMNTTRSAIPGSANTRPNHSIRAMLTRVNQRERLAEMLHRAGALKALMRLRRIAPVPSTVSILTYHHVADEDSGYPYDQGVADATPKQFRRQMELLVRYGTPIG